jgi:hypothetical protein
MHEFARQLDHDTGAANGVPYVESALQLTWAREMQGESTRRARRIERRSYGRNGDEALWLTDCACFKWSSSVGKVLLANALTSSSFADSEACLNCATSLR